MDGYNDMVLNGNYTIKPGPGYTTDDIRNLLKNNHVFSCLTYDEFIGRTRAKIYMREGDNANQIIAIAEMYSIKAPTEPKIINTSRTISKSMPLTDNARIVDAAMLDPTSPLVNIGKDPEPPMHKHRGVDIHPTGIIAAAKTVVQNRIDELNSKPRCKPDILAISKDIFQVKVLLAEFLTTLGIQVDFGVEDAQLKQIEEDADKRHDNIDVDRFNEAIVLDHVVPLKLNWQEMDQGVVSVDFEVKPIKC